MGKYSIPVFAINLRRRTDRRENVMHQFSGRNEFSLNIVEACEDSFGAIGLWNTITYILKNLADDRSEFIILCEDDIQFTPEYSSEYLFKSISLAEKKNADVLLGGVSWFASSIQITENLFWVENFSGLHFTVIFKKFFTTLLESSLGRYEAADFKIASLSSDVMFMYPFISIQKEFGYSDVTPKNNQRGHITELFKSTEERIQLFKIVKNTYIKIREEICFDIGKEGLENITIPTYIISNPERTDELTYIKNQFIDKKEFDITVVEACKYKAGPYRLWHSIRKIIELAILNDDDIIIICEDGHQFTEYYSKEHLFKNIIEAHKYGASYLSGGTTNFGYAIPITENLYWVNSCLAAQFVVLYKKIYNKILKKPFNEEVAYEMLYSEITSNKMMIYPFISKKKYFNCSDNIDMHNKYREDFLSDLFSESNRRLETIQKAYKNYKLID